MKSNEERVQSIRAKVKQYKNERSMTLYTMAVVVCAMVAVAMQGTLNQKDVSTNENNPVKDLDVASASNIQENISTFSSKEELLLCINDMAKKYGKRGKYDDLVIFDAVINIANESASDFSGAQSKEDILNTDSYSKTNTQVQGVDEADIVKTNGKKIFYIAQNKLFIFDATKTKTTVDKEISFKENVYPYDVYLDDNYFVVLASSRLQRNTSGETAEKLSSRPIGSSATLVLIYDVNSYELLREIEVEGNEISSRKIGNDLYIVTNKYIYLREQIEEDEILPIYRDSYKSGECLEIPATQVKYFNDFKEDESCNFMIITSFSLDDMARDVNINTYLGAGKEVYCSKENLYVAKIKYSYSYMPKISNAIDEAIGVTGISKNEVTTNIHKFAIGNGDVKYVATGKVKGRLLNQFSMDEYSGNFRITTTNDDGNNLYVLNTDMQEIGSVTNLASGEKIYATRFMGEKAYVVTYKTVDPLFVIDLSTLTAPKVLGELKMPGYSSYLHPFGENYLIGFGEDSVEKSYTNWEGNQEVVAYANGLKMAIFDVSDYNNPKELYSIRLGSRGSYSQLLHNHKALLFDETEGIFAFPAYLAEDAGFDDDGTPRYGNKMFSGALVYDVSVENGIALRGKIEHIDSDNNSNEIQRIIRIGNKLYTLSNEIIKSSDIKTVEDIYTLDF